MSLDSINLF